MFTSTAQKITSWTSDLLENTLFGSSKNENAEHNSINIDENSIPDGFSILEAFSTTQSNNLWLMMQRVKDFALGKLESTATGTADAADVSAGALSTAVTVNPNIANGGTAVYTGIPVGTSVAVYETNDNVGVTYTSVGTITTAENGDTNAASKAISYNVVSNTATVASTSANNAATGNKTVAFTNDFTLISPTGIVTRFAPYALILIGGVALLVIAMKKRKHTEED